MISRMASLHKRQFDKYVASAGRPILVRQPIGHLSGLTPAQRVMGTKAVDRGYGEEKEVICIFTNDLLSSIDDDDVKLVIAALGKTHQLDAVIRVRISDALSDPDNPQGTTIFETAKDVVFSGEVFEVTGTQRTGLPPLDPYVLWVGLRKGG